MKKYQREVLYYLKEIRSGLLSNLIELRIHNRREEKKERETKKSEE